MRSICKVFPHDNMLFIISNYFRYKLNKILHGYIINFKNLNHLLVNHILHFIFYKNKNSLEKLLNQIIISLLKTPIKIVPNRNFKRIRLKPIGKWYFCIKYEKKSMIL